MDQPQATCTQCLKHSGSSFHSDIPRGCGQAASTEPGLTPPLLAASLSTLSGDLTQSTASLSRRADHCLLG